MATLAVQSRPAVRSADLHSSRGGTAATILLDGVKALVPLAVSASLLVVAARIEDAGPALFLVESGTPGVRVQAAPAMGVRAAAHGEVLLEDVRVPDRALLASGDPAVYPECLRRARLAWCALRSALFGRSWTT